MYNIEQNEFGIVVMGEMPIDDFLAIAKSWENAGWDLIDALIAEKLHACYVVTSKKKQTAWREKLGIVCKTKEQ